MNHCLPKRILCRCWYCKILLLKHFTRMLQQLKWAAASSALNILILHTPLPSKPACIAMCFETRHQSPWWHETLFTQWTSNIANIGYFDCRCCCLRIHDLSLMGSYSTEPRAHRVVVRSEVAARQRVQRARDLAANGTFRESIRYIFTYTVECVAYLAHYPNSRPTIDVSCFCHSHSMEFSSVTIRSLVVQSDSTFYKFTLSVLWLHTRSNIFSSYKHAYTVSLQVCTVIFPCLLLNLPLEPNCTAL